jgi:NAD(P)-dependent dehydrogenase (short-subunit alcohol dehydrogenase family)
VEATGADLRQGSDVAKLCASVAAATSRRRRRRPLRLVVHCAGVMATTWRRTKEGVEETAAVNALTPARLADGLLRAMFREAEILEGFGGGGWGGSVAGEGGEGGEGGGEGVSGGGGGGGHGAEGAKGAEGAEGKGERAAEDSNPGPPLLLRMVTVGSFTHRAVTRAELRRWMRLAGPAASSSSSSSSLFSSSSSLSPASAYACSKAAAAMHAFHAHRRWSPIGFSAVVADPGLVDTAINREWPPLLRGLYVVVSRALRLLSPPSVGAAAVLHACFLENPEEGYTMGRQSRGVDEAARGVGRLEARGGGRGARGEEEAAGAAGAEAARGGQGARGEEEAVDVEAAAGAAGGCYVYGAAGVRLPPSRVVSDPALQAEVWSFLYSASCKSR